MAVVVYCCEMLAMSVNVNANVIFEEKVELLR